MREGDRASTPHYPIIVTFRATVTCESYQPNPIRNPPTTVNYYKYIWILTFRGMAKFRGCASSYRPTAPAATSSDVPPNLNSARTMSQSDMAAENEEPGIAIEVLTRAMPQMPMTFDERQYMCDGLETLGYAEMQRAVQIFRSGCPQFADEYDEKRVFEIEEINIETQRKLHGYIQTIWSQRKITAIGDDKESFQGNKIMRVMGKDTVPLIDNTLFEYIDDQPTDAEEFSSGKETNPSKIVILKVNWIAYNGNRKAIPAEELQDQPDSRSEGKSVNGVDTLPSAQSAASYLAWLRQRDTRWPTVWPNFPECVAIGKKLGKPTSKVFEEILYHWLLETDGRRGEWHKEHRLEVLGEDPLFDEVSRQ